MANEKKVADAPVTKVVTGKVRFSYVHVWEPTSMSGDDSGKKKYSVSLIIPKTDTATVDAIKKAIAAATAEGVKEKWGGKTPANLKLPLRDGDTERADDDSYKGCWFVNASSVTQPGIVDAKVQPILNQTEFYSGCYGKASVNFYPFNNNGAKGVACGLNNVQKTHDGEALGGRSRAEDDFAVEEGDDLVG